MFFMPLQIQNVLPMYGDERVCADNHYFAPDEYPLAHRLGEMEKKNYFLKKRCQELSGENDQPKP